MGAGLERSEGTVGVYERAYAKRGDTGERQPSLTLFTAGWDGKPPEGGGARGDGEGVREVMPGMKGPRGEGGLMVTGWTGRGERGGEETGLYGTGGGGAPQPHSGVIGRGIRGGGV